MNQNLPIKLKERWGVALPQGPILTATKNTDSLERTFMQPKGLLTIAGSLDISQFWPATKGRNSSDGDTVHLKVNPNASFLFSASPSSTPKQTTKFIGAYVID